MTAAMGRRPDAWRSSAIWLGVALAILAIQIVTEHFMGRLWICSCGDIKLFEPSVHSSGNSQHISDWYTPSHIIHGFIFYGVGFLLLRRHPVALRLAFATLIEAGWEILENSPIIIERYRSVTASYGYEGDSILNSAMDTVAMAVGFFFAARAPVWLTIVIAIGFEIATAIIIRDNLALNIIMLVWPIDAIRQWQSAL